jgi:hypothetical protein
VLQCDGVVEATDLFLQSGSIWIDLGINVLNGALEFEEHDVVEEVFLSKPSSSHCGLDVLGLAQGISTVHNGDHLPATRKVTLSVASIPVLDCLDNQYMMFRFADYIPGIDPVIFLWEGFSGMHLDELGLEGHGEVWVVF